MRSEGEQIFWKNARCVLRDIGMNHLPIEHGAAVDAVRWSLTHHAAPEGLREGWLEHESPALLAYLESISSRGAAGWRATTDRLTLVGTIYREKYGLPGCTRPSLLYLWHALPEMAAIGGMIMNQQSEAIREFELSSATIPALIASTEGKGGDAGDGSGNAGSAASVAAPKLFPRPRLRFPAAKVQLSELEKEILGLKMKDNADAPKSDGPSGVSGPEGVGGPGGKKGGPK